MMDHNAIKQKALEHMVDFFDHMSGNRGGVDLAPGAEGTPEEEDNESPAEQHSEALRGVSPEAGSSMSKLSDSLHKEHPMHGPSKMGEDDGTEPKEDLADGTDKDDNAKKHNKVDVKKVMEKLGRAKPRGATVELGYLGMGKK